MSDCPHNPKCSKGECYMDKLGKSDPPGYSHSWSRDGERCVKCGDKDWMGGSCSKPDEPAGSGVREWWIYRPTTENHDDDMIYECDPQDGAASNIHVVEASAYRAVCAERDELRTERNLLAKELEDNAGEAIRECVDENDALREDLAELRRAAALNTLNADLLPENNPNFFAEMMLAQVTKERDSLHMKLVERNVQLGKVLAELERLRDGK